MRKLIISVVWKVWFTFQVTRHKVLSWKSDREIAMDLRKAGLK